MEENELRNLLTQWEMPGDIVKTILDAGYDVFSIEYADHDDLKDLFPSNKKGLLVKFKQARSKWISARSERVSPDSNLSSPQVNNICPAINEVSDSRVVSKNLTPVSSPGQTQTRSATSNSHNASTSARQGHCGNDVSPQSPKENPQATACLQESFSDKDTTLQSHKDNTGVETVSNNHAEEMHMNATASKKAKLYDLDSLLKESKRGRDVLAHFKKTKSLSDAMQDLLVAVIIEEEQRENSLIKISTQRLEVLAEAIVTLFVSEQKPVYISKIPHPGGSTTYGGKLYRRYYNERRKTIKLLGVKEKDLAGACSSNDSEDVVDDPPLKNPESILILETQASPVDELMQHWKNTAAERLTSLKADTESVSVESYFKRFPCLQEPDGYNLLISDFDYMYPKEGSELYNKWATLSAFIIDRIRQDQPDFLKDSKYSTNEQVLRVLSNISQLFGRITVSKKNKKAGKGELKPSRVQSQDAFMLNVEDELLIEEKLQEKMEHLKSIGLRQQPQVVVVGPIERPTQYLCVIDNFHYDLPSPLKAIDTMFKAYQSLNCRYPPEAEHIWLFLQKGIYGINTKYDRTYTTVTNRLADFKRFQENRS